MLGSNICPICQGAALRIFIKGAGQILDSSSLGSSRAAVSHETILRCQSCGFGFLESRLSERHLAELYSNLDHKVYEAEADGRARTAIQHFKIVRRTVASGTLLDVGCSSGAFLRICSANGFHVTGVEPAKEFAARAQALLKGRGEVFCATLQDAPLENSIFDVVTLWDVLEHVTEPIDFLRTCGALLKPGGYLFLNVPDLASVQATILGRKWPLLLPEHLNYFTRQSLKIGVRKAGFEILRFGTRPAFFSIGYVLDRLAQHNIPGMRLGKRAAKRLGLDRIIVPVMLGEIYGVCSATEDVRSADG
jgi:SAM-dependent methyltransferase